MNPGLPQESLRPFGAEVSQECPRECSRKRGRSEGVSGGECLAKSVWRGVCRIPFPGTLSGNFLDTLERGAGDPLPDTPSDTPRFRGHSRGHSREISSAKGPRDSCSRPGVRKTSQLAQWHVSPQRFASDSASQKFRRDTVRVSSATWAHESQRFLVTRIAA